ncbi:core-binding factor subunit beta [Eurytemora carolleeae]|uniref:core-binding factor subunit beta n=1 Tax=Eurytemora carolleeae TaxID=1294199 RepID=UPI000C78399B|nr:core-binding factor subunit beta [Eurytemora carolleeae]|eukprot:XP_023321116.1 core-binding factor subunit beta-like [Eurytemora affinis]
MIPYGQYDTLGHHHAHTLPYQTHSHNHTHTQEQQEIPKYSRLLFKLPRVVPDQREKFETEDLFKKHTREGEVRYTLYRDRPNHERQAKFQAACRDGHTEISFSGSGLVVLLNWNTPTHEVDAKFNPHSSSYCDFNREQGKVHILSSFILNGVCVRWRGWLDLERLDGSGLLELDEALMVREEQNLQKHLQLVHQKLRECEERYRTDADLQMKKLPGYI